MQGGLTTGLSLDEPEEHAEEKGVEEDDVDDCSGKMEELTPQLVLISLPETYNSGQQWTGWSSGEKVKHVCERLAPASDGED